ncbi:MAG: class I SAM-dependent methyltransferase [Spirochaetes bacterium]|nr:class I SAM-dependent methyltransferase [Spirochaetota bacterium]MBU0956419.1 class I SAM-dependent methyltransferase [Spirochaetota bacterium]
MKTYYTRPKSGEQAVAVHCPLCGIDQIKTVWQLEGFSFQRCRGCGHIYQNPRPRPSDLGGRYDDAYTEYEIANRDRYLHLMLLSLADLGFDRLTSGLTRPVRLLDIGCATGALVETMQQRGWQAEGVEPCSGSVEYGRKRGLIIHEGTLDTLSLPAAAYDVIHSSHVIEHVPEPADFVRTIRYLLKPGGFCFCTTPNRDGWQARLSGANWRSAIADHVHLFSLDSLKRLHRQNGLTPLAWKTWGGLAEGLAPRGIKKVADRLAKQLGGGDVMILLAQRPLTD